MTVRWAGFLALLWVACGDKDPDEDDGGGTQGDSAAADSGGGGMVTPLGGPWQVWYGDEESDPCVVGNYAGELTVGYEQYEVDWTGDLTFSTDASGVYRTIGDCTLDGVGGVACTTIDHLMMDWDDNGNIDAEFWADQTFVGTVETDRKIGWTVSGTMTCTGEDCGSVEPEAGYPCPFVLTAVAEANVDDDCRYRSYQWGATSCW